MKKLIAILFLVPAIASTALAQGLLKSYDDPEKGHTCFIPKGCSAIGLSGSYRSLNAGGVNEGDGYSIFSLLNIGGGDLKIYSVSPGISWFIADDLALGLDINYNGYNVDTDLRLDLRSMFSDMADEDTDLKDLNLQLSSRHLHHNAWGASVSLRKYLSFFGSKTFGIFGEGRLYGLYGMTTSWPLNKETKTRTTNSFRAGLKLAGGAAVRLRDGSTFSLSIPVAGAAYSLSRQHKADIGNDARISDFRISRDIDYMAIQFGYSRFIEPKRK